MTPSLRRLFTVVVVIGSVWGALAGSVAARPDWRGGRSAAEVRFTPGRTLLSGSAAAAGLRPDVGARLVADAAAYLVPTPEHPEHPAYAGAVVLAARHGVVAVQAAVGDAVRYGVVDGQVVELAPQARVPMRTDTRFDIASLTKLFTSVVVLQQVERGAIDLDAPVVRYLPEFAAGGKSAVTVRQLLTHTAGLDGNIELAGYASREAALAAVLAAPLAPGMSPGGQFQYSDLSMITLGAIVERVTGHRLDTVLRDQITGPLGLTDTGYTPAPDLCGRTAATEYQPGRGMVRGAAHDEKVAPLGGVAGHAGIFSTARDLAVFGQLLLDGGRYGTVRLLREETVRQMLVNANARFPGDDQGLGVELNQPWYMGPLASPVTFGHTGFTGTSIVVDPRSQTILVLLTNQVHPDRQWSARAAGRNIPRRTLAGDLGSALVG